MFKGVGGKGEWGGGGVDSSFEKCIFIINVFLGGKGEPEVLFAQRGLIPIRVVSLTFGLFMHKVASLW